MRHYEVGFQGFFFPPSTLCYNSSTRFPGLVIPTSGWIDIWMVEAMMTGKSFN